MLGGDGQMLKSAAAGPQKDRTCDTYVFSHRQMLKSAAAPSSKRSHM